VTAAATTEPAPPATDALLDVRGLTVVYGGVTALADVDLTVGHGEVVGLIGPNGAGKTTCIDAVGGFVAPARGRVVLAGRALDGLQPHARVGAGLARTFQACELFPDLTVRENLAVAAQRRTRWSWVRDAVQPRRGGTSARVGELLERLGLAAEADARPAELPHGRQRLVDLARALATRPRLVLLDEPAAGLDRHETDALGDLLRGLPDLGVAVLLVDHDMGLVMRSCARIHVLDLGRVIASGPPAAVRSDPAVVAAYLGGS
jgi:ABC-type branched-subunit amino acid transport system ATPase component